MKNTVSKLVLGFALLPFASYGQTQGFLENPQPNSNQSGISVMSGWHCDAGVIEMQIDGGRFIPVPYGSERQDTEGVCSDWNNGFAFLLNYSGMGDGLHTISVYADGALFGSAQFNVATFGLEFLSGQQRTVSVNDFPNPGDTATLQWDEAKQGFVLTGFDHMSASEAIQTVEEELLGGSLYNQFSENEDLIPELDSWSDRF